MMINGEASMTASKKVAASFGYVGPDPFFIPGTIRENLLYGLPPSSQASDAELWNCLKQAHVDEEVRRLQKGLDEHIYEWAQLSTGQRQRIAIARALLRKPSLLVLDEATANVDENTENRLVGLIQEIRNSKTILIVSHKHAFDSIATQTLNLSSPS
jgi:ATP-binding cassette subfamily B protein